MGKVRSVTLLLVTAMAVTGCELLQPPPSEDPVLIKLEELDRRLQTIERVMDNQSLVALAQQVDALERRADQMQGNSETIRHEASTTSERQRLLFADLDARIQALESSMQSQAAANVLDGGTLPQGQLPIPSGSDRDNYQVALELLREERYDESATAFKQFLVTFPESSLAANAQYWLAESYYAANQFEQALTDFTRVIDLYPRATKVPDALLKMGYCNYSLQRWDAARETLMRVKDEYPETTAARLADQYLTRMTEEGV